jgi:hypothetical protein
MPPVFDHPVAETRGAAGGRSSNIIIISSVRPQPDFARKKQKHFPMSKGLIWLMFHPLQVRQGPMEN